MTVDEVLTGLTQVVEHFEEIIVKRFPHLCHTWDGKYGIEKWSKRLRLVYHPDGEDGAKEAKPWTDCKIAERLATNSRDLEDLWNTLIRREEYIRSHGDKRIAEIRSLVKRITQI